MRVWLIKIGPRPGLDVLKVAPRCLTVFPQDAVDLFHVSIPEILIASHPNIDGVNGLKSPGLIS